MLNELCRHTRLLQNPTKSGTLKKQLHRCPPDNTTIDLYVFARAFLDLQLSFDLLIEIITVFAILSMTAT